MMLLPITKELASTQEIQRSDLLKDLCASIVAMYGRVSSGLPWVGYLAEEHGEIVGTCAYKSPPVTGEVEIAYFTFPKHEGRGVATRMVQRLVDMAFENGASLVKAQTLPEKNASTRILEKCGFAFSGLVTHPEDGDVWEWHRGHADR